MARFPKKILLNPNAFLSKRTVTNSSQRGTLITGGIPNLGVDLGEWIEYILTNNIISGGGVNIYELTTGVTAYASNTNVTGSVSSGVLTVNVPEGTKLHGLDITGTSSFLDANIFKVAIVHGEDNDLNDTINNLQKPVISIWDLDLPAANSDNIDETFFALEIGLLEVPRKIIKGESNDLTIKFEQLNNYNKWGIGIKLI